MAPTSSDFVRIYRLHAQSMLTYYQRRLDDPELATDLLAETFAVAIERAEQYRGRSDAELSGWIWAIGRSLLREAERRGAIERGHLERLGIERRPLMKQEADRLEELAGLALLREELVGHLERLPPPQREAVRLRMLDELSYPEVAARLGINEEAARARVSRGLTTLRRRLTREEEA